jgi:hypothetical protein
MCMWQQIDNGVKQSIEEVSCHQNTHIAGHTECCPCQQSPKPLLKEYVALPALLVEPARAHMQCHSFE